MARYVDIENCGALVEVLANMLECCHFKHKEGCLAPDCRDCLHRHFNEFNSSHLIPTADVRPERHGHWIEEGDIQICSECGEKHSWQDYRASYCDVCGAKMDGIFEQFEQELEMLRTYETNLYTAALNIFGDSIEYTRAYRKYKSEHSKSQASTDLSRSAARKKGR